MSGYSGTPLHKKLGIKEGHNVLLLDAPSGFRDALGELPHGVRLRTDLRGRAAFDVILFFAGSPAGLRKRFAGLAGRLPPGGGLWVAWLKKSSGVATDLDFGVVQRAGLDAGLVDNKVCALDDTWSALRFVYRLEDRPKM